jgi:surfactin synthase thioesterase subunit
MTSAAAGSAPVVARQRTRRAKWFLREPDPGSAGRVFCLPYSGSGASLYRNWPRYVGDIEICPVQLPGRENRLREPAYETYQALASGLISGISRYFDRPFGLFGHCGSALAAYELAVQLCAAPGPRPSAVFVSSQVAPQDGPYGNVLTMDDAELREELRSLVVEMGNDPPTEDLLDVCLRVMRPDVQANARYVMPDPPRLPVPLVAIGWSGDTKVRPEQMLGWPACGDVVKCILSGHHFSFIDAPPELLETLAVAMGKATDRDGG